MLNLPTTYSSSLPRRMYTGHNGRRGSFSRGIIQPSTAGALLVFATAIQASLWATVHVLSRDDHYLQTCQCGRPSSHIHSMRKERNAVEYGNGESSPHTKANLHWALQLINIIDLKAGGPVIGAKGKVCHDKDYERKERKGKGKCTDMGREPQALSTLNKAVQRSQSEDGNERYERNELLLLKRPSTQTNQTNTSGRNTSPYSPSSRGGSAASAVGDRECINKQGRRLDPSHPRGGRGGSAASAAAGDGVYASTPASG